MTTIFLRDDDAGSLTPELLQFVEVFEHARLPVSYQVIPAKLTDECAAFLRGRRAAHPALFEFGQHGLTHRVAIGGVMHNHEFGPETGYAEQARIIGEGRAMLDGKLGDAWDGALFTPPQHKFDRNTLRALAANGFTILSASAYVTPKHRIAYAIGRTLGRTTIRGGGVSWHGRTRPEAPLIELSIGVVVDAGEPLERDIDKVMAEIAAARRVTPWVGLMFHHQAWPGPGKRAWLELLAQRLKALDGVRFATIGDAARESRAAVQDAVRIPAKSASSSSV